jgi:hypothetical protein
MIGSAASRWSDASVADPGPSTIVGRRIVNGTPDARMAFSARILARA